MEDIEDLRIFVPNVDKDKMSDMTANIIKKQLIDYTQSQCGIWGINLTSSVPSGFYWNRFLGAWENTYTKMLIVDERKILLVPKRLVSYSTEYTPQKYMQHFALNYIQNNMLLFNDPLVQRRKNGTPFVTKKTIRNNEHLGNATDKSWLAVFTEKHPEVFRDFRDQTHSKIQVISNAEITAEPLQEICSFLIDRLINIPLGPDYATDYHRTIVGIMELLFYPYLCNPVIEREIHEGRKRRDLVFDNCAEYTWNSLSLYYDRM